MTIAIEGATHEGLAAVAVRGELDIRSSPDLRAWLSRVLEQGASQLAVDLSGVSFMDSSGLGVLVGAHKRLARGGSRLQVIGASPAVVRLLTVTGLIRVFDMRDAPGVALVS